MAQLKQYVAAPDGQYYKEVALVAEQATTFFHALALNKPPSHNQVAAHQVRV